MLKVLTLSSLAAAMVLGGSLSAQAQVVGRTEIRRAPIAYHGQPAPYRVCNRQDVADCQSDARLHVELCQTFGDAFACAGEALSELRACWAATGCF